MIPMRNGTRNGKRGGEMEMRAECPIPEVSCRLILREDDVSYSTEPIDTQLKAVEIMKKILQSFDRETVCVLNLDNKLRPINWNMVSIGGLNRAEISIPNIFKTSILSNAAAIMMFHNHPSGDPEPSPVDDRATKEVKKAGKLLGIPLIDHIIIGAFNEDYYSYSEHGKM